MFRFSTKTKELVSPSARYDKKATGKIVILGNLQSATVEFYFRSRKAKGAGYTEIDACSSDALYELKKHISEGCTLILVRDVPVEVLKKLDAFKCTLSDVIWFIDDDIPAAGLDATLPARYRKRMTGWYKRATPLLENLCSKILVSTPCLAKKYNLASSAILSPVEPVFESSQQITRCFYHGTSSHQKDWEFVLEVTRQIQLRNQGTWFEFIGDHALYKACRGIPRVTVLHPLKWPDYLALTSSRTMDIGLAPLADTPFNLARSHTKFLDICRQKAVGIYSRRFSCSDDIEHAGAGLVLGDSVDEWVAGIEFLIGSDCRDMYKKAEKLRKEMQGAEFSRTFKGV
ncbi:MULTISPECIES: hypothetical protein [unclassified Endozoicomonas]|uniref:hypothetical protein n=1 Tax=unclassified Endozoicomonas TaxID=2644528 RepID=UPI003BB4E37D